MWIFFIKKSALWGSGLIFFKYYKEIAYSQICGNFNWNCRQIVRNGMKGKSGENPQHRFCTGIYL